MPGLLKLLVLGKPEIYYHGASVIDQIPTKALALLIYLAVMRQPVTRPTLAGLLWGDQPEETARANLRLTLSRLRKVVGDSLLVSGATIAFDFSQPHEVDLLAFESQTAHPAQADPARLAAALALYRGELGQEFSLRDAPTFETWLLVERTRLHQQAVNALTHLAEQSYQQGAWAESIDWTRRTLHLEPWQEEAHRRLIELFALTGQRSAALTQYETCRRLLADELDAQPSAETVALVERIRRGDIPDKVTRRQGEGVTEPSIAPATLSPRSAELTSKPHLLTLSPATPLIGREQELAQLDQLLRNPACRLLTLLGPGGSGKTRLALATAAQQAERFAQGVRVVPLAGVNPNSAAEIGDLLVVSIASALAVTFAGQRPPRAQLIERLQGHHLLLVLDNFEQLRAGADLLGEMLAQAPQLQLLVTSRERLGVQAEWVMDVAGLAYPVANEGEVDYPAAQLFCQAAQRLRPDLDVRQEARAIHRICELVRGVPLGLLLAANWVHALSCQQIADRLAQDLDLLSTTATDLDERHRSLRAVWDYSWRLLTAGEQQTLRRLALFPGDFALAAAEHITAASAATIASLVDKSLVQRSDRPQRGSRYLVHELLRQYASEALNRHPAERQQMEAAYCAYYAALLNQRRPLLKHQPDPAVLAELDTELTHLRAVRDQLLAQQSHPQLADFVEGLWHYYQYRGWFPEAIVMLAPLEQQIHATQMQVVRWNRWLGEAYYQRGDFVAGRDRLAHALTLLKQPLPSTRFGYLATTVSQAARQLLHRLLPGYFFGRGAQQAEPLLEAASIWWQQMGMAYFQGDNAALLLGMFITLNLEEQAGARHLVARSYATFLFGTLNFGWHRLARYYCRLCESALPDAEEPLTKAYVYTCLALYHYGQGAWLSAEERILATFAILIPLEQHRSQIDACGTRQFTYLRQGKLPECLASAEQQLALGKKIGDPVPQAWARCTQAIAILNYGTDDDLPQVTQWLEEARLLLTEKMLTERAIQQGLWARCLLRQNQAGEALAVAEEALRLLTLQPTHVFYMQDIYSEVADVLLILWEQSLASPNPLCSPASLQKLARQACTQLKRFSQTWTIAQPIYLLVAGTFAWLSGKRAQALAHWQQSLALATRLQMPYEQALAHYTLGLRLATQKDEQAISQSQQHLQEAHTLFAQIQARGALAKVEILDLIPI